MIYSLLKITNGKENLHVYYQLFLGKSLDFSVFNQKFYVSFYLKMANFCEDEKPSPDNFTMYKPFEMPGAIFQSI